MKQCSKCGNNYEGTTEFFYYVKRTDRLTAQCKICIRTYIDGYKEKNKEQILERRRNSLAEKASSKKWKQANSQTVRKQKTIWDANNRDKRHASSKKHRDLHIEEIRPKKQQSHIQHREADNARSSRWMAENRKRRRVYEAEYRRAHPDKMRAQGSARRARVAMAPRVTLTAGQWEFIKRYHKHRCYYCGATPKRLTKDHIIPLAKSGPHSMDNIVPACQSCNSKKWINSPPMPVQPFLDLAI